MIKYSDDAVKLFNSGEGVDVVRTLCKALKEEGLTLKEFQKYKLTEQEKMSADKVEMMKRIRGKFKITGGTLFKKVMTDATVKEYYVNGKKAEATVGGYISRAADSVDIVGYAETVETFRLDYIDDETGKRPFPDGGDTYWYMEFNILPKVFDNVIVPFGKYYGGNTTKEPPFTGNGFTAARNDTAIPEWICGDKRLRVVDGAKLYKVVDGITVETYIYKNEFWSECN